MANDAKNALYRFVKELTKEAIDDLFLNKNAKGIRN